MKRFLNPMNGSSIVMQNSKPSERDIIKMAILEEPVKGVKEI